jgi:hypothetical protein
MIYNNQKIKFLNNIKKFNNIQIYLMAKVINMEKK